MMGKLVLVDILNFCTNKLYFQKKVFRKDENLKFNNIRMNIVPNTL